MDKSIENLRSSDHHDDVVVLGTASVETRGPAQGTEEILGNFVGQGIAAE